jgi:hypothetical protein
MTLQYVSSRVLAAGLVVLGCANDDSANSIESSGAPHRSCVEMDARRFDATRRCFLEAQQLAGVCARDVQDPPSASYGPVCLVSPASETFVAYLGRSVDLSSDSWTLPTREEYPQDWLHYPAGSAEADLCDGALEAARADPGALPTCE